MAAKHVPFAWSEICQDAFNYLKDKLCSASVLALPDIWPDSDKEILNINIGKSAINVVSSRIGPNAKKHIIEMLTVVIFIGEYRPYLQSQHITLSTDQQVIQWIHG